MESRGFFFCPQIWGFRILHCQDLFVLDEQIARESMVDQASSVNHDRVKASRLLQTPARDAVAANIPSSSPAFGTPVHPIRPQPAHAPPSKAPILPVLLPPATLRPTAFRSFTKKHNLTLNSAALQGLATFIGKHCGAGWREEGLAEKVLEEVARSWKKGGGGLIVDGESQEFRTILKTTEGCMDGGRVVQPAGLSRHNSTTFPEAAGESFSRLGDSQNRPQGLLREDSQTSLGFSTLGVDDEGDDDKKDPRHWLQIIGAFDQPRLEYNADRKHFEKVTTAPSFFPEPSKKTNLFRQRYHLIHQRLLRNESFQTAAIAPSRGLSLHRTTSNMTQLQAYKLTPIANLLGRTGSSHILLGLLTTSTTGNLVLSDLTGSIALDISHARPIPANGAWFAPGMMVVVDGIYEEDGGIDGAGLGGGGGVGGTIGGRFVGLSVGGPPCERRDVTLGIAGIHSDSDTHSAGGFGWVDFLGVGSERSTGSKMRAIEKKIIPRNGLEPGRSRVVVLGEVNLDEPRTLQALRKILGLYAGEVESEAPMTFILVGNFVTDPVLAGVDGAGSIEYKEYFDGLASVFSEFPTVLQAATFVFVPGDNDPWASAFSAGAATVIPRKPIPDLFTTRIKRVFASANAEVDKAPEMEVNGEAIWTTNPARISLFGPAQEIVVFRDDMSGRLRRSAVRFDVPDENSNGDTRQDDEDNDVGETNDDEDKGLEHMDLDGAIKAAESSMPGTKNLAARISGDADDLAAARKLIKTILDQGNLSPFPLSKRPVLWDYGGALQLYPLPTAMVLVDRAAPPFCVTYEGCHVMNPGPLVTKGRTRLAQWIEYDAATRRGKAREVLC